LTFNEAEVRATIICRRNNVNTLKVFQMMVFLSSSLAFADDDERLIEIKTKLWPTAYKTQNEELLGSILHSSFQMIDVDGSRSTREKELDYVRNNKWDPGEFTYVIERLDIYEDRFAIIDGKGDAEKYTYTSSNVFIKENGEWKAVASHVSGYKEK